MTLRQLIGAAMICSSLSGCLGLNFIDVIREGEKVSEDSTRAYVLVGFASTASDKADARYKAGVAGFDPTTKMLNGSCFRDNHGVVDKSVHSNATEYVLFRVPSGSYVIFNGGSFGTTGSQINVNGHMLDIGRMFHARFEVKAGQIVYLGDVVYQGEGQTVIEADVPRASAALAAFGLPPQSMKSTVPTPVKIAGGGYVCTP